MAGPQKKAIVRTLRGDLVFGYLPASGFVAPSAEIELLDPAGRIVLIALESIRSIAFVRDFNLTDTVDPERLVRRTFLARPRTEGLWVRLTFADGEGLEGLAPLDIALLDGILSDHGLHLTPPDTRANTQRLFVPRTAIAALQLLAVVTTPSRAGKQAATPPQPRSGTTLDLLFPAEEELQSPP